MTSKRELPDPLRGRPFTTAELVAAGASEEVIRRIGITTVTRGVHVDGEVDETTRLRALGLVLPAGSAFACHTAARIWSLPLERVLSARPLLVHARATRQVRRAGVLTHIGLVDSVSRSGVRVTTPTATFVDLAAHLDDGWLLACGDAIVRRHHADPAAIVDAVTTLHGRRGIVRARRVAALIRPGVDSPMESLLRLLLMTAGLPEPAINVDVRDGHGGWIARPDLSYPTRRIAIEYDGRHHFDDRRQWENDIARRHNLEDEGWVVRIATAGDVLVRADRFGADMHALWQRRG